MKIYKEMFKKILSKALAMFRGKEELTMEETAHQLKISSRSYADLEHGKFAASGVVFLLFLIRMGKENREKLLDAFEGLVQELDESSATAQ